MKFNGTNDLCKNHLISFNLFRRFTDKTIRCVRLKKKVLSRVPSHEKTHLRARRDCYVSLWVFCFVFFVVDFYFVLFFALFALIVCLFVC